MGALPGRLVPRPGVTCVADARRQATVHLRIPAAAKAAWIRASRAVGMRLTDWITQVVEAHMLQAICITIPEGISFADLRLARDSATGDMSFDWAPVERVCEASGIDVDTFRVGPEDRVSALLVHWYMHHLARGGARDACADDLLAEAAAEDARGGGISAAPGRA